jgi:hypothetical protein
MDTEATYTYGFGLEGVALGHEHCWLRAFSDKPCAGRMDRAHLIERQRLKKEGLGEHVLDEATWRPACRLHHFSFDAFRGVVVPRLALPVETERFAERHGLGWYLDRRFGEPQDVAA